MLGEAPVVERGYIAYQFYTTRQIISYCIIFAMKKFSPPTLIGENLSRKYLSCAEDTLRIWQPLSLWRNFFSINTYAWSLFVSNAGGALEGIFG